MTQAEYREEMSPSLPVRVTCLLGALICACGGATPRDDRPRSESTPGETSPETAPPGETPAGEAPEEPAPPECTFSTTGQEGVAALECRIYQLDGRRLSIFDTRTGEWRDGARSPHVSGSVSLTAANGRVYAVHSRRDVAVYEPERDAWTDLPRLPGRNMSGTTPIAVGGALYAFGGEWRVIGPGRRLDEGTSRAAYILREGAPEWEELPEMPTALAWSSAVLHGGLVWLIGGTYDGAASPAVLSFDPESGEWAHAARLPRPCKCAATTLGGRLYAFGREIDDRIWGPQELDVESGEWRPLERRPHEETGRWIDAAVTIDDTMLVLTHSPDQVYELDPTDDAWTRRHPPEAPR